jgi:hypothetical protein
VPGQLQGNARSLRDSGWSGRMRQQNARAVAIQADAMQHRRKLPVLRRVPVGHANNLQTVHFHLLIAEHAHSGRRNGTQIFAVVSKLLMISRDKIHAVRRRQFVQRLRGSRASMAVPSYKSPAIKIASGSSRKIFATMRRRKLPFRTCPRCTSLISAALRPRHAAGKFASRTVVRVIRVQLALKTP